MILLAQILMSCTDVLLVATIEAGWTLRLLPQQAAESLFGLLVTG